MPRFFPGANSLCPSKCLSVGLCSIRIYFPPVEGVRGGEKGPGKKKRDARLRNRWLSFSRRCRAPPPFDLLLIFSEPTTTKKKKKKLTSAAADPKVVVDGTYGLTTPSSIPVFGKLLAQPAPNLAAKLASLRSALNASQPRLLPNVSGILAAKRANNATQADLGLKQNVRRAEGEVLNSLAGFADRLRTKGDAIMTW